MSKPGSQPPSINTDMIKELEKLFDNIINGNFFKFWPAESLCSRNSRGARNLLLSHGVLFPWV